MERCAELALCSDDQGKITRLFCTPAMRAAHDKLRAWMESAGGSCRVDAAANLICRFNSSSPDSAIAGTHDSTPTLLVGSHIDSVVDAGRFDGVLGVLMGLAVVEIADELQLVPPFSIDVVAFSEEEGVRFASPYIGSRGLIGELTADEMQECDSNGTTVAEALRMFGCSVLAPPGSTYRSHDAIAYIEPHIEQGPLLEARGLAIGIVTGIVGQTRAALRFVGRAGHAGTVDMAARQDALTAVAEFILSVEKLGRDTAGLVATVGQINVTPNVGNVIAGEVAIRLDVRHPDDSVRQRAVQQLFDEAENIAKSRQVASEVLWFNEKPASQFDAELTTTLADAARDSGQVDFRLPSGAGHDAAIMSRHIPTAMLFLRCAGGISHHPDECVSEIDVAIALEVLYRFVLRLAAKHQPACSNATT
jgi:allantoate deiminase